MQLKTPKTIKEIAAIIRAEYDGDPEMIVSGLNEIHRVKKGDITFVDHPKYYKKALSSAASTIIINKKMAFPNGKALIFSDDPFRDFVSLVKKFSPFQSAESMISPSATIGKHSILQPGVFIGNHVSIGKNCLIHPNVTIYDNCVIGDHVVIHSGAVIGADAFYFKRRTDHYDKLASCGRVVIEDNVEIGANTTIDKGVSGDTVIGAGTKLDNLIQVGHDTIIGKNCLFAAQVGVAGCVNIEDDVILWGQVGVQKDLTIGKGAVVLGQSGIAKSLDGNKTYFGSPVKEAKEKMKELAMMKRLPEIIERL